MITFLFNVAVLMGAVLAVVNIVWTWFTGRYWVNIAIIAAVCQLTLLGVYVWGFGL